MKQPYNTTIYNTALIGIKSDDLFYNEFPANVDVYISMPSGFTAYNG